MSLLMDALRKAEEQKQKLAGGTPHGPEAAPLDALSLEPIASPPDRNTPVGDGRLPELPSRLEDLDEQFIAHAASLQAKPRPAPQPSPPPAPQPASTPAPPPADSGAASRESARKLFEAKQPVAAPGNKRGFAIAVGALTFVGVVAIGGYFWWQLQPRGGLGPATPAPPLAVAPAPPPAPAPIAVPPAPTFAALDADIRDEEEEEPAPSPPPTPRPTAPRPAAEPAQVPDIPIRLAAATLSVDPYLEQAWQAFNRGEFDLARLAWEKTLTTDPRNSYALHGMAALAQQQNQPDAAAEYYLRALEVDPKDARALAGLAALRAPIDALQTESRLKTLLAGQPESPYLYFALGNLYSRSMRWAEAQQAYFRAHAADPVNPDYLFNLAVSLDQLRQRRLAAQYYQQAIAAAAHQPAGFDPALAATRLKDLTSD